MPVQKQTFAGQRTRFKAFVVIGGYNGHVGLGIKCSKELATAIHGTIFVAKLSIVPMRRDYWRKKTGKPDTVLCKVTGCCGLCWGCTATLGNFTKAIFDAISKTYSYLIPDLWKETVFTKSPYQEFTDHLVKTHNRISVQRIQAPAVATRLPVRPLLLGPASCPSATRSPGPAQPKPSPPFNRLRRYLSSSWSSSIAGQLSGSLGAVGGTEDLSHTAKRASEAGRNYRRKKRGGAAMAPPGPEEERGFEAPPLAPPPSEAGSRDCALTWSCP
ncbi:40S ribosomal protein S2 [Heterocephalus glaber]|uniref:40S ribosomal protein S2 n=1 Tax=Heterocephalus glaber TaxID=10181 RepID=G5ATV0_HETGA|nr:40S ribosomal protein S2 [Heterocephalus glaber]